MLIIKVSKSLRAEFQENGFSCKRYIPGNTQEFFYLTHDEIKKLHSCIEQE